MRLMKFVVAGTAIALCLSAPAEAAPNNEPATIGFGVGYYDVNENSHHNPAIDFRLEYRAAFDMLQLAKAQNSVIAIRPFGGVETTSDGALYGLGGFVFDMPIGKHFVVSPNIGVGLYYGGDGKRLGSFVEFRSTFEVGYRFDDASRLTVAYGHISNAGLTSINHGAEIANVYYHIPFDKLFGR
jgi:hypothetical protein